MELQTFNAFVAEYTSLAKAKAAVKELHSTNESYDSITEANAKTLSIQQRRAAGRRFRRLRTRIKVARKRALRKTASVDTLNKRSRRSIRSQLFKKFSRGKSKSDVGMARRAGIERRINRLSKNRINSLMKRQRRTTRKIDRERRSSRAHKK